MHPGTAAVFGATDFLPITGCRNDVRGSLRPRPRQLIQCLGVQALQDHGQRHGHPQGPAGEPGRCRRFGRSLLCWSPCYADKDGIGAGQSDFHPVLVRITLWGQDVVSIDCEETEMYDPVLSKVRFTGPLTLFAPGWREALVADGCVPTSVAIKLQLAAHFSRWLGEQGLVAWDVTEGVIREFLVERRARHTHQISFEALGPFLDYLRSLGVIPVLEPHVPACR